VEPKFTKAEIELIEQKEDEGGLSVETVFPEWFRLTQKPLSRGGDAEIFKGVQFSSKLDSKMTSSILLKMSEDLGTASPLLVAFTLGLWLGQTKRSTLEQQLEDLDS